VVVTSDAEGLPLLPPPPHAANIKTIPIMKIFLITIHPLIVLLTTVNIYGN